MDTTKLLRDIDGLRESIRLDWADLAKLQLSGDERRGIQQHIDLCIADLKELVSRLPAMPSAGPDLSKVNMAAVDNALQNLPSRPDRE
jgi:hypothetical protein